MLYLLDKLSFLLFEGNLISLLVVFQLSGESLLLGQGCLAVLLSQGCELRDEVLFLLLEVSRLPQF